MSSRILYLPTAFFATRHPSNIYHLVEPVFTAINFYFLDVDVNQPPAGNRISNTAPGSLLF